MESFDFSCLVYFPGRKNPDWVTFSGSDWVPLAFQVDVKTKGRNIKCTGFSSVPGHTDRIQTFRLHHTREIELRQEADRSQMMLMHRKSHVTVSKYRTLVSRQQLREPQPAFHANSLVWKHWQIAFFFFWHKLLTEHYFITSLSNLTSSILKKTKNKQTTMCFGRS